MAKLEKKEFDSVMLCMGLCLLHLFSMFIKGNYTASVAYIVSRGIFSKTNAGTIASSFYLIYAVGQVFGGYLVDKFSPYKMITLGVIGALVSNVVLCFTTDYITVLITWTFCGLVMFGIWPGVCKIMSTDIIPKHRSNASVYIQYADQFGGLLSYVFAAFILEYFGWSAMFLSSVISMILTLVIWVYVMTIKPDSTENVEKVSIKKLISENRNHGYKFLYICLSFGLICIIALGFFDAVLLNGAQVWIPTMVMESYEGVTSGFSNLISVVMFAVRILALFLLRPILLRVKKPVLTMLILYAVSLIPLSLLQFIGDLPLVVIVIMLCVYSSIIKVKAVYMMQVTYNLAKFGYSGTYSGILNALAALGIVVSGYGFGYMSEAYGWIAITLSWLVIAGIMVALSIFPALRWRKFKELSDTVI